MRCADRGHARRSPKPEGYRDQDDEGVELEARDQHNQRHYRDRRAEEQRTHLKW